MAKSDQILPSWESDTKKELVTQWGHVALENGLDRLPEPVLWDLMSYLKINMPNLQDDFKREAGERFADRIIARCRRYRDDFDPEEARVLDLGCGPGRILIPMAKRTADTYGIDISKKNLQRSRSYASEVGVDVTVEQASDRVPMSGPFDLVFSVGTFMRMQRNEMVSYMRSTYQKLSPSGIVYFDVPNLNHEDNRRAMVSEDWEKRHSFRQRYFTSQEMRAYLDEIGYDKVEIREYDDSLAALATKSFE